MRVDVPPLETIRAELGRIADLPRERSVTMPPAAYFSEAFLGHELREIFAKEWVCVGRVEEVAEPGDYFAFELVGESLLVVRGDDRVVRVLSNVCRHRWSQVASGQGNTRRFVCPYHAWTYDLEGSLVHTRFMESSQAFDPDCRLPRIATEIWQGFIYVNLDGEASPLAPRLAGLAARIGDYHMEEMVRFTGGDEVWDTNWKLLTENFTEAYHNPQTHKDSLEPVVPAELTSYPGGDAAYSFMVAQVNPDKPPRVPHHPDLSAKQQTEVSLAGVFPSQVFALAPERVFYMCLSPVGVDKVLTRWGVGTYAPLPRHETPAEINALYQAVNQEDRARLEGIQRSLQSSRFIDEGPLSYMEASNWEFYRYLASRLA